MRQPRELRGDRRGDASPVELLTQAKTSGSPIQCRSLPGTATSVASLPALWAMINVPRFLPTQQPH